MAKYYDQDFDWADHALLMESKGVPHLPPIVSDSEVALSGDEVQDENWNDFYSNHDEGLIYKPRRYLIPEFAEYLSNESLNCIVEVGCGYGCTCFPIISVYKGKYVATDCSQKAIDIFDRKVRDKGAQEQITTAVWNIEDSPIASLRSYPAKLVLCIFSLSAVNPDKHIQCLQNMRDVLNAETGDAFILFRDYGMHDMTMFRHRIRLRPDTYMRQDRTLCHYFTLDYLRYLAESVNLEVRELRYATVINRNRKTAEEMRRVFVHAVLCKPHTRSTNGTVIDVDLIPGEENH